jgi:hypothetical protein
MCQIEGRVPDDSTRSDAAFNNVIMAIVHFDILFVSGLVCLNLLVSNIQQHANGNKRPNKSNTYFSILLIKT